MLVLFSNLNYLYKLLKIFSLEQKIIHEQFRNHVKNFEFYFSKHLEVEQESIHIDEV
jgi:hypothetical protein